MDDDGAALPVQPTTDLVIASSNGSAGEGPSRFARYPAPLLTYNAANHDDELLSTAGQPGQVLNIGDVTVAAPNHPAAGGKTGSFKVVTGDATFDTIGRLLPESATILATFPRTTASEPSVTEKVPWVVLIEEGAAGGKVYGGGPFVGFEGNDFFAGAGLNKFATDVTPKTLTLKLVDVSGRKNLKLSLAVAAAFLDFETTDFLDVFVDPDGEGPTGFDRLIGFAAPNDEDKFLDDASTNPQRPAKLGLRFQDVTYDLPAGATKLVIRIEALNNWWNEIVGFDNVRITAGDALIKPAVGIRRDGTDIAVEFTGVLQTATNVAGPWTDVPNAGSPYRTSGSLGRQFFRARSP